MKIPDKLINEAVLLDFKYISTHDLELFKKGIFCAEILMKQVVIDFISNQLNNSITKEEINRNYEQYCDKYYKDKH